MTGWTALGAGVAGLAVGAGLAAEQGIAASTFNRAAPGTAWSALADDYRTANDLAVPTLVAVALFSNRPG